MSPLGLKVYEFLAGLDGVTCLSDSSVRGGVESITCCYGGGRHGITFVTVPANCRLPEIRFADADREEDWE